VTKPAKFAEALTRADRHAPYLRQLMKRFPETAAQLAAGDLAAACVVALEPDRPIASALRRAKGRLALALAIGDLSGALTLEAVVGALSDFADLALDHAIKAAIEAVVPGAEARGFAALALGKHGSRELNYSSDIDPILIFDPLTMPCRPRDEPVETAVRIAQKTLNIMQARDADGYVFRVDLRLRPSPEATPLALPVNAAISYYESSALPWERAAFIRARACAGDMALGHHFLDAIQPFIWRRGLDFGVVQELRSISNRIREHYDEGQEFGPGYDLKRGRGGIRECEFFAQIQQLIHGGRDRSLRVAATMPALAALARADWISETEAGTLSGAYRLLRTIEHRLQMVDDQQTHSLPTDSAALDNVARLHGLKHGDDLLELLAPHVTAVGLIFDGLGDPPSPTLPRAADALNVALEKLSFKQPDDVARRIATWRSGKYRAVRSPSAHEALEAVLPALLGAFAEGADPLRALNRFDQMLERLPSAVNLFLLLHAQPALLSLLTQILCYAPTLANELARRADLLDGLIDATALAPMADVATLVARLRHDDPAADLELRLDRVRQRVGEWRFALGAQIIAGTSDPLDVAAGYARVAEAALIVAADAAIADFAARHGHIPDSELVILALGRMGGGELTHASDLDLIFVFTGDYRAESDGAVPIGAMHYYNRLAQRVASALSVPTAAGPLYEVDTRLRPSGAKGELCVSLAGFARYQQDEAWTWEHMALCRARVVYGSATARAEADAIIRAVLAEPHDRETLIRDATEMRVLIAESKAPSGPLDVKLGAGGLVDLEFCVHVSQLLSGRGLDPQLGKAIALLDLPTGFDAAYQLMTRMLVLLRLVAPDLKPPPRATKALVAEACGVKDWATLMRRLKSSQALVSSTWAELISANP
jgi:glutamate-ammonia-ligase adenylyltransferase